jgi:hypothetical protein
MGSSQAVSAVSSCSFSPFFSWLSSLLATPTSRASACARRSWGVQAGSHTWFSCLLLHVGDAVNCRQVHVNCCRQMRRCQ